VAKRKMKARRTTTSENLNGCKTTGWCNGDECGVLVGVEEGGIRSGPASLVQMETCEDLFPRK